MTLYCDKDYKEARCWCAKQFVVSGLCTMCTAKVGEREARVAAFKQWSKNLGKKK